MELGPRQIAWVEALESGNYIQGKRSLCDEIELSTSESPLKFSYCCLGVAKRLVLGDEYEFKLNEVRLDYETTEYYGFHGDLGETLAPNRKSLSELNDDSNFSFKAIAGKIRRNPEYYFTEPK